MSQGSVLIHGQNKAVVKVVVPNGEAYVRNNGERVKVESGEGNVDVRNYVGSVEAKARGNVDVFNHGCGSNVEVEALEGNVDVRNLGNGVKAESGEGNVDVLNHIGSGNVDVKAQGDVVIKNYGDIKARLDNGSLTVMIEAAFYRKGAINIDIDRRHEGPVRVEINAEDSYGAKVEVHIGTQIYFGPPIESGPVSIRLTDERLEINELAYKL